MGYIDHHGKDQEEDGRNLFRCWTGKAGNTQARHLANWDPNTGIEINLGIKPTRSISIASNT